MTIWTHCRAPRSGRLKCLTRMMRSGDRNGSKMPSVTVESSASVAALRLQPMPMLKTGTLVLGT